ncbi:MAG TPA: EAL domain-containing protein, partial [Gemmatimonadales bacterium]|nr:EAL domain-containing protein [Gemmatimonadales bacterium]
TLKLRTIAEGIEIAEQRSALISLGCEMGQGYFFAQAMPAAGVERLLAMPDHERALEVLGAA